MKAARLLCVVVAGLLSWSAELSAQYTTVAGGTGGKSYTLKCNEGDVLVGLRTRHGGWIVRLRIVCATAHVGDGSWTGTNTEPNTWVGSIFGSQSGSITCPGGYAIKSFSGKAGWYVNSIIASCNRLTSGARTTSTSKSLSINSTTSGGSTYGPYPCTDARPAIGVRGKADLYVDSFGLICGYIMPGTPTAASPAKGSDVTIKRPTFRWDAAQRAESHKICVNLSSNAACSITGTFTSPTLSSSAQLWTPSADLPFARGDLVYWRVEACNKNGCKYSISNFRYMPQ